MRISDWSSDVCSSDLTLTASLVFHPQALPGLEAELTWFDIDYEDRVLAPLGVLGQALSNPEFADFVEYAPSAEQQAALLAAYDGNLPNITGAAYHPGRVVEIGRAHVSTPVLTAQ